MEVKLIDSNTNGLDTIIKALNKCRHKECTERTVNHCIQNDELACLEFCWFAFEITDVSRVVLAEITRHRHFSFMVESQRHVKPDVFFVPDSIENDKELANSYMALIDKVNDFYNAMCDKGIPKQDARYVMPNAAITNMVMAGNGRTWFEYLEKRLCKAKVQPEHFKLASMVYDILVDQHEFFRYAKPCYECTSGCVFA